MKEKNKFIKTFGLSSLALLIACTGICTFVPITTTSGREEITTSGLGLDPKNDPVVYTTESGLEIKMSNAFSTTKGGKITTKTNRNYTYTQDLTSYYYFTMGTYSGTVYVGDTTTNAYTVSNAPVNWVIIGLGEKTGYFVDSVMQYLFSTWQAVFGYQDYANITTNGGYFFENIYETTTPAGQLIKNSINLKTYIMDKASIALIRT